MLLSFKAKRRQNRANEDETMQELKTSQRFYTLHIARSKYKEEAMLREPYFMRV